MAINFVWVKNSRPAILYPWCCFIKLNKIYYKGAKVLFVKKLTLPSPTARVILICLLILASFSSSKSIKFICKVLYHQSQSVTFKIFTYMYIQIIHNTYNLYYSRGSGWDTSLPFPSHLALKPYVSNTLKRINLIDLIFYVSFNPCMINEDVCKCFIFKIANTFCIPITFKYPVKVCFCSLVQFGTALIRIMK